MSARADGSVVIEIMADDKEAEKQLDKTKRSFDEVGDSADSAAQELSDASEGIKDVGENANKSAKKIESAEDSMDSFGKKTEQAGEKTEETAEAINQLGVGAAAVSATLIAAGAAAVSAATEFDAAYAKTQTIMDQEQIGISDMRADILALSRDSAMAGAGVSDAVYNAISGSVATADAVGFVNDANKLAVAGFTDLSNATDVLTTVLNAYGLEASAVVGISNVLITTQNLGKTTVDALASSMGRAISTGSAYGVNLQNLSTAYVELTRGGIDTAEATTYLSGMLNELGDAGSVVGKIVREETGMSFGQLMQQGYSLGDVLQILSDSVDGNAEALMGLWSSQEAGKASNAIMTQGVEDFNIVLAQMNEEMAGATGTTQAAYKTMTSTSEFIDQKLGNSCENLAVAVGEHLSPALNAAKTALTGIVEKATDVIEDSPVLVAVVAGAAVGFGALSLSLAAYTIKAEFATRATRKLTAALNSNGYLAIISAVLAVVAAVITYIAQAVTVKETIEDQIRSVEELTVATENYKNVMESSQSAFDDTNNSLSGTKSLAQQYIDRLKELETQQSMTAAEASEYSQIVSKLQSILPDLNIELNEQTGLLEAGAAALEYQIDNWYELAVAQAMQQRMTEQIEAQAAAEAELLTREHERNKLLAERGVVQDKLTTVNTQLAAAYDEMTRLGNEYFVMEKEKLLGSVDEETLAAKKAELDEACALYSELDQKQDELTKTDKLLSAQEAELDKAIAECNETISANAATVQDAVDAYNAYVDGTEDIGESTRYSEGLIYEWDQSVRRLADAYDLAKEAARDSLDNQIGLWQKMDNDAVTSIENVIQALDSQITYLANYSNNLEIARALGVSEDILQALSDGSQESAAILAGIANASADDIAALNASWSKVSEGKDTLAEGLAEYDEVVLAEGDVLVELAAGVGLDMSDAMTDGLLEGLPLFRQALHQFALESAISRAGRQGTTYTMHAYATGTASAASGYAIVGENGPELIFLNGGERILTAEETKEALATVYPTAPAMRYVGVGAPSVAGRGSVQLRATIAVPVYVDGREIARSTAEYMGEEMEFGVM